MAKAKNNRRAKPEYQLKIAKERIQILLEEAMKVHKDQPNLAKRYFLLAKKIGMRYNVRLPKHLKRRFCKYCFSYISEGWRFKSGRMYVKCRDCGRTMRYPYKPRKDK
jgi:ribonuclease P protein subunit RPR2